MLNISINKCYIDKPHLVCFMFWFRSVQQIMMTMSLIMIMTVKHMTTKNKQTQNIGSLRIWKSVKKQLWAPKKILIL